MAQRNGIAVLHLPNNITTTYHSDYEYNSGIALPGRNMVVYRCLKGCTKSLQQE